MRRAALAGVETIEHGGEGTPEVFKLMAEHHVALCPTHHRRRRAVAAGRSRTRPRAMRKRASFKAALDAGVTILNGSDVGTFPHGDNARELEAMVAYGMPTVDALKSATSIAARVLHMEKQIGAGEAGTLRRPRRVRRRPDEGHRGAAAGEVRDEERDRLPAVRDSGLSGTAERSESQDLAGSSFAPHECPASRPAPTVRLSSSASTRA